MKQKILSNERAFTMIVEQDPESGWFVGEVVELPGCFTQAPDLASLEKNISEAISLYLEVADSDEERPVFVGAWRVPVPA